jgi:DNA-directed RNA polymerase subunit M/transcription elongation factor TFIIS
VNCKRGNPLQFCTNCGAAMIAAKWAAYVTERCVLNVWSCEACECEFETSAFLPV